ENSNTDSALVSTKRSLIFNQLNKELYKKFFLTTEELQAIRDGYIYIHDMSARRDTMNCCLFDVANVLKGGFEMGNLWYNEPKTLDTAFDVIGDIVLSAASQQYGGFTVPSAELILEPYAEKSYKKYMEKYRSLGIDEKKCEELTMQDIERDFEQGFQGWEYKFNSVSSSRGDYPFITVTAGTGTGRFARLCTKIMFRVRMNGQGKPGYKKPVLFPKLVFLYDEKLHGPGGELEDVFEAGIDCSAKTMYPDWLSLTGEGYVPSMYKKYGKIVSPMGCRAFLSPWYERGGIEPADENDTPVFVGRFNIGAISLHLPMILAKSRQESKDFYEVLDYYLELIRQLHCRTYDYLGEMRASTNPLAYCEGGFYGGKLGIHDKIKPLLKSATASFGITAFNELQQLYNKKSLYEDGNFALDVLKHINDKIAQFKKEDGHLYAIYGTPAESLCGLQITQFRSKYGVVENVSDREYVSNSFHCHVTEDITPIEKQDSENRFWNLANGGKIQYVKYPISYNREAIKTLVRRAMDMGLYEGVNLSLAYCDDCGHEELEMDVCPVCGSKNLTKIDRMNGYLSYSRVKGDTRLNAAKMAEIAERKSM
ncbi:MAG: anaerobic ribonucleoside-triphosphate reductase, partial [Candidatus Ornithomonoglobus sp.]